MDKQYSSANVLAGQIKNGSDTTDTKIEFLNSFKPKSPAYTQHLRFIFLNLKRNVMRTQLMSDQELVDQYLAGNELALERLITRHKDKIYTSIYLMVKDEFLAEDIFQETFIKAIDTLRAGKYNEEGKFAPWVARIAYNLCIDHFRKLKRLPGIVTSEGDDIFKYMKFEDTPVEEHLQLERFEGKLKELIERLPEEQKEVVILRHFFNFSFKEVAEYTQSPINTCLGRMRYALINLRKLMEENNLVFKY